MKTVSFKTRARTLDHLGREQIADVPTAVSELWKNSYDAYARNVSLTIFDQDPLTIAICDDGHGMNYQQLIDGWLVIGTETKLFSEKATEEERNGLSPRPKQGQKGIGRLSSAHLGSLLLLISKRPGSKMAAALVDWRLFENPYLMLQDVEVPLVELDRKEDLLQQLPGMKAALLKNVTGEGLEEGRAKRILAAWSAYDSAMTLVPEKADEEADEDTPEDQQAEENASENHLSPSKAILAVTESFELCAEHLECWPVWKGSADRGTAMIISNATEEFAGFLPRNSEIISLRQDFERFSKTLGSFVDPLSNLKAQPEESSSNYPPLLDLQYAVYVQESGKLKRVIGSNDAFNRQFTDSMEHVLEGRIDESGIFRGQVKAFGKWRKLGSDYVILPPKDVPKAKGPKSQLGPIDIYIATYEQEPKNTTHSEIELQHLKDTGADRAGLMIFRDGLRVLPYGREDNDFFEIEKRRSVNAGREYWNARRIFGRIAISRTANPNLKDKAGREGFIVNPAAKSLRALIINVLRSSAYEHFGSNSASRAIEISETQQSFREEKARKDQERLRKANQKGFRTRLRENLKVLPEILEEARRASESPKIEHYEHISDAQLRLEDLQQKSSDLRLPSPPPKMGTFESDYRDYRRSMAELSTAINVYSDRVSQALADLNPPSPSEILIKQIQRAEAQLTSKVTKWAREIKAAQESEQARVAQMVTERNKLFRHEAMPLAERLIDGRETLTAAARLVSAVKAKLEEENQAIFEGYISALEHLREDIDIQGIALLAGDDNIELRSQVDRLNGLAQLGITVEFLDHELHSHDSAINEGLYRLLHNSADETALAKVQQSYAGLKQILDFLGPLRMAGRPAPSVISGQMIYDYVRQFFLSAIDRRQIDFEATDAFLGLKIREQKSRIYPVFVNLVNNSIYWLINSQTSSPKIILDARDETVVISDNGPGVDDIDVRKLFTLFFTRKVEGGRGVGLYLCRANLVAGGHSIRYISEDLNKVLPGANFQIKFKNAEFDV